MTTMNLNDATVILALDGHSLASQRANEMPFFLVASTMTRLLNEGLIVIEEGYGSPFPRLSATREACDVWRKQVSERRAPVAQGR